MTPAQRRQAYKTLLDNVAERTFTSGLWSVTIKDAQVSNGFLRVTFVVRRNGTVRIEDEWVAVGGPPVMVDNGPNPAYDPNALDSAPRLYREDVRAAFRSHFLEVVQGVIARRAAQ